MGLAQTLRSENVMKILYRVSIMAYDKNNGPYGNATNIFVVADNILEAETKAVDYLMMDKVDTSPFIVTGVNFCNIVNVG